MTVSLSHRTVRLITLAKAGDRAALEELCRTYSERIRRIIRLRMGKQLRSKLESMDIVQDAMISALRGLGAFTYTNEGDFTRWLSRIAENRLRDSLDKFTAARRDARREIPLDNSGGDDQPSGARPVEPAHTVTPSVEIERFEQLNRLERAVEALRPEYRQVVLLTKIEGLSQKQVAEKMGKSPDAIRMLLCRAMAALSEVYERGG